MRKLILSALFSLFIVSGVNAQSHPKVSVWVDFQPPVNKTRGFNVAVDVVIPNKDDVKKISLYNSRTKETLEFDLEYGYDIVNGQPDKGRRYFVRKPTPIWFVGDELVASIEVVIKGKKTQLPRMKLKIERTD